MMAVGPYEKISHRLFNVLGCTQLPLNQVEDAGASFQRAIERAPNARRRP